MDILEELLGHLPENLREYGEAVIVVALAIVLIYLVIIGFAKAAKAYREDIRPLFYNADERRRVNWRQRFARHIEREIFNINSAEEWSEHKFAELEAEVEAEGRRRGFSLRRKAEGLRREKSLSRALRNSRERLILLEGEPGSGKSVALRYLTTTLAEAAGKSRDAKSVIPLYINLKSIERAPEQPVDRTLIEAHVLKTLNRTNDRDIADFLNQEFRRGMQDGTWLFLFDSFDEIPDVLSVTSAETTIREYGLAIADFLGGFNQCRGVVASRYFRGPGSLGWPRFVILALSDRYRRNLIKRYELPNEVERSLIGEVELRDTELSVMTRNPMFLGLLCEYMAKGAPFPENAHDVFESYVSTRFERDEEKLQRHFGVDAADVRKAAEQAAFCMASYPGLGLSPGRAALIAAMQESGFTGDAAAMLEAIEYIKLARAEEQDRAKSFTFAHRRFQEYFATCVVLAQPELVPPEKLLSDARWRETAVVMLQTHENVETLLAAASGMLEAIADQIDDAHPAPSTSVLENPGLVRTPMQIAWPPLTLHLLGLLQSAFRGRGERLPESTKRSIARIAMNVGWNGSLADRKWLIEVAGVAPQPLLTFLLRDAYASGSALLGEVAYRQVSVLRVVHEDIAAPIRRALVALFASFRLDRQKHATRAHLMRIGDAKPFLRVLRLLLAIGPIDVALHAIAFLLIAATFPLQNAVPATLLMLISVSVMPLLLRITPQNVGFMLAGAIFTRFICFVLVAEAAPAGSGASGVLLVLALLAALWAPLAVFAAKAGQFVSIGWWPFLPLFPLLYPIRNVPRGIRAAFAFKWQWQQPVAVGLFIGFVVLLAQLDRYAPSLETMSRWCCSAFGVLGLGTWLVFNVRDRLIIRNWLRADGPHDAAAMVAIVAGLIYKNLAAPMVRTVRQRSLLAPTESNEQTVRDYALKVEASITDRALAQAAVQLLDELTLLAEHLRTQRKP